MNIKRLRILIISIIALLFVSIISYFIYSAIVRSKQTAEIDKVRVFSESFIRDYTTYMVSAPEAYNKNISSYILPSYLEAFLAKYELGSIKSLDKVNINNYSQYKASTIAVSKAGEAYDVLIEYTYSSLDKSWSSSVTTENNRVELSVVKESEQYYITNFAFLE